MIKKLASLTAIAVASTVLGAAAVSAAPSGVVTPPSKATADIVTIASSDGRFTTLVAAVGCSDPAIAGALTSGDQYTVFAPTDAAFANIGLNAGNVCDPSVIPTQTLSSVLLFHVTEGRRFSNSVVPKVNPKTVSTLLAGESFTVDRTGTIGSVSSPSAPKIVVANVAATNGVVHVVDQVLLP